MNKSMIFAKAPVIQNMLNAIRYIQIQAELKVEDKYILAPEHVKVNQILIHDGADFLSRMYINYIIYGKALAYKTKTLRAAMAENDGNPIYDYCDGAVAGIHVIDADLWELDEDTKTGEIKGVYINKTRDLITGSRNYLKRSEFIYTTDWNPESRPIHSIWWFIENKVESMAAVLGVDNDLMDKQDGMSSDRRDALIKRAMEDTIIPAASKFTRDLQDDIGLQNDMRLVLNAGDMDLWTRAWDGITNRLITDVIIEI